MRIPAIQSIGTQDEQNPARIAILASLSYRPLGRVLSIPKRILSTIRGDYSSANLTAIVAWGSFCIILTLLLLLVVAGSVNPQPHTLSRVFIGLGVLSYVTFAIILMRLDKINASALMLSTMYGAIGIGALFYWGINSSVAILTLGFYIILTGALFGSKYTLPSVTGVLVIIFIVYLIHATGIVTPNLSLLSLPSTITDVLTYATIFSAFGLISWLSRRHMEKALAAAVAAEENVAAQKVKLAEELTHKTQSLREAQMQEMTQLYHFAEIGQNTTAILHELANSLSILNIDIDDLKQHHKYSKAVIRAEESIIAIEGMVKEARKRLTVHVDQTESFNALATTRLTIKELMPLIHQSNIKLVTNFPHHRKKHYIQGNTLGFSQALIILIKNAIDACADTSHPSISITISSAKSSLTITIADTGKGISPSLRSRLFLPLSSSKKHGLGIGLYMAKQIIETQCRGSLILSPRTNVTEFSIRVPTKSASS